MAGKTDFQCRFSSITTLHEWLFNGLGSALHQRNRAPLDARKFEAGGNTQAVIDGRGDLTRSSRPVLRSTTDVIGGPHHLSALERTPSHNDGPALRPVVATAGRIDFRRAAKLT